MYKLIYHRLIKNNKKKNINININNHLYFLISSNKQEKKTNK